MARASCSKPVAARARLRLRLRRGDKSLSSLGPLGRSFVDESFPGRRVTYGRRCKGLRDGVDVALLPRWVPDLRADVLRRVADLLGWRVADLLRRVSDLLLRRLCRAPDLPRWVADFPRRVADRPRRW